jgi:hypothetical protein
MIIFGTIVKPVKLPKNQLTDYIFEKEQVFLEANVWNLLFYIFL